MKSNGWSSKKEKVLKYWQEECRLYVWLHNENARYYKSWDKILSIPAILITAVTGTAVFSTTNNQSEDSKISNYLIGGMLMIGTFLQSTRDFLDIGNLIYRHSNCAKCYQSLVNDIEEQLTQDREDRENGKQFLHKIKVRKNDIINNGMTISSKTWKKLKTAMQNGEVINLYNTSFFHDYLNNIQGEEEDIINKDPQSPSSNPNENSEQELKEVLVNNSLCENNPNTNNNKSIEQPTNKPSTNKSTLLVKNNQLNKSDNHNSNHTLLINNETNNETNTDSTDEEEGFENNNLNNINQIQIKNKLGTNFNNVSLLNNNPNKTNSNIKQLNYQMNRNT